MSLNHTVRQDGATTIVLLNGSFTFSDNAAFRQVIEPIVAAKPRTVMVDLSGLSSIDSAGLSMLVLLRDRMTKVGGTVTLKHPPKDVARILEVVDFGKLFTIVA